MLNVFRLDPEGQIFVDCRVPPGKPIWRQSGSILVGNSEARPAESVNDLWSRAVFKHCFKKKSLRSPRRQRIRSVRIRIEKDRIVPAGKAAKFVCKCQTNGHQPFPVKDGMRMPAPTYLACHCEAPSPQSNEYAFLSNKCAKRKRKKGIGGIRANGNVEYVESEAA